MDSLNRHLFALAAYNCGPGNVRKLRREASEKGLNPNEWFNNVEILAAHHIGMEPVQYVSNIYRYYWLTRHFNILKIYEKRKTRKKMKRERIEYTEAAHMGSFLFELLSFSKFFIFLQLYLLSTSKYVCIKLIPLY